jgi:NH3-dependent NAD+ synthetase
LISCSQGATRNFEVDERVSWVKGLVKETGIKSIGIGLSGGKDSAAVVAICVKAGIPVLGVNLLSVAIPKTCGMSKLCVRVSSQSTLRRISANATRMDPEVKAKLHLSHYQDFLEDDKDGFGGDVKWNELAMEDGLTSGFVHVGQTFEV